MNWLRSSMQARLMSLVGAGLLAMFLVAEFAVSALNGSVQEYRDLLSKQLTYERNISEINYEFKIQVQEWKNVLLRGFDEADREKYWDRFKTKHQLIQEKARALETAMGASPYRAQVEQFRDAHKKMYDAYNKGFEDFVFSEFNPVVGDQAVRGIDREPAKLLDETAASLAQAVQSDSRKVDEAADALATTAAMGLIVAAVVILALLGWTLKGSIILPIHQMVKDIQRFGRGDFSRALASNRLDEIGDLTRNLESMRAEIVNIIAAVKQTASALNEASGNINETASEIAQHTGKTEHFTDQVSTAINEMSSTVQEVAGNAAGAADAAQAADNNAKSGLDVMQQTIAAINTLSNEVDKIAVAMDKLEQDTSSVGTVLGVIKGIAEQTNLLALNAAIEAARAGEQGRGFAVVADEVRGLAQRTQESTAEIQQIIETVQSGAATAVRAMRDGQGKTSATVELAGAAGDSIRAITDAVSRIRDMNTQIATAAEEQSYASDEISRNVGSMAELAQNAHSSARRSTEIANELDHTAQELTTLVAHFKV
ncbi:methyl-accepting chemotaxis protein [Simiduia agarivorans]|uniref:Methyl-accepting chemotaxis sensory transducer n=1 Tax=Simiduia agarivorans (strain DSM 21679 / JCM 13881 / BCRC 17597 / SA1) TaxID=1117647 RepID=K4KGF6_SIMAS|nr:methyl-accepting chemotaxis protein [Simiduia agarivorans]AFU97270.2 methyl-accepting chemotaxis sensory transducer [Simiduia agarivorans SA1 = DSM 21679]